jgi:hypothetical protein
VEEGDGEGRLPNEMNFETRTDHKGNELWMVPFGHPFACTKTWADVYGLVERNDKRDRYWLIYKSTPGQMRLEF